MSPTTLENPIGVLNPISDAEAARCVSSETVADLTAAIVLTPVATHHHRRRRSDARHPARRPALVLAASACAAVALVLSGSSLLSSNERAHSADAAILSAAAAALHPEGSIVIQSYETTQTGPAAAGASNDPAQTKRWSESYVTERPTGEWRQNWLQLGGRGVNPGEQSGEVNGNDELYDPATNTVYVSSTYGSDITAGTTPGTYSYTLPTSQPQPLRVPSVETAVPPLTLSAQQAQALRDGTAEVTASGNELSVTAPFRTPDVGVSAEADLGKLQVGGITTVGGRAARRLVSLTGRGEYDVEPGTSFPVREIVREGGSQLVHTWTHYQVLPATPANQRLLDLAVRHPGAHVDHNHADYLAALAKQLKTLD